MHEEELKKSHSDNIRRKHARMFGTLYAGAGLLLTNPQLT